ncbi:hypothetical protein [Roseateles amylovorans]|uniref:Uncharacterized protein n=1 Tax=Roseateles amylovorans TaxID=2978473 RepID=A0ABY6AYM6_9BURK|nr:hypothetical protein [Roseateles amylovorans]UXH76190.1 hypothetical protein N4261_14030 [Roseateles amylovorans]
MSKETDWIEQFTGMSLVDGSAKPGTTSLVDQGEHFEKKRLAQRALLSEVRERLQGFKAEFQTAMSTEIKTGRLKGQKLLNDRKTQLDEIEAEDFTADQLQLSPEITAAIARGTGLVINENERLRNARFRLGDADEPLFGPQEIQAEFWTPLMRERILPETYIPAMYSETQQMLDATSQRYLDEVENRKAQDALTPAGSRGDDLLGSAADLMDLSGQMIEKFALGSQEFQLATTILTTGAAVLRQGTEVYGQVKDRQYADASAAGLDVMGSLTQTVLAQCGVDKPTTDLVKAAFGAGHASIAAGQAFARGAEGVDDALTALAEVCAKALGVAASATDGSTQTGLSLAARAVPDAFVAAAQAREIRRKVEDQDYAGVAACLGEAMKTALQSAQALREIKMTQGKTEQEAAAIRAQLGEQTQRLGDLFELGATVAELTVKTAIAARRGEFLGALNELIGGIAGSLNKTLVVAGLPRDQAGMIANCYQAAASAPAALQCLMTDPPKVDAALKKLSGGVATACAQAGNDTLSRLGSGLAASLNAVATGLQTHQFFVEKQYGEGIEAFVNGVKQQLDVVFQLDGGQDAEIEKGGEEGDGGALDLLGGTDNADVTADDDTPAEIGAEAAANAVSDLLLELKAAAGGAAAEQSRQALQKAQSELIKRRADARRSADEDEAARILAEAQAELKALSGAQEAAAEASSIDALIAKMARDRLVWQLAQQIAEGGAAFLAKFVPALGAVGAGIKLAASLHAAGLRAQQLHRWMQLQDDFEAAQSALASSSRNFVKNQGDQLAHHAAQALWAAAELAGASGAAGPAGTIVSAVATAGSTMQAIIEQHRDREALEAAWQVIARALRNPGNRKLGLQARALNGSLAKYSMAWGAVELKDPLARNAMKACDLNEASLNNEDSNVDKVVAYLESFYEDDPQLYRELDEAPGWMPRDLTLNLASWARLKRQAETHAQLSPVETGHIDGWLALYESQSDDDTPAQRTEAARKAWSAALTAERDRAPDGQRPAIPEAEQQALGAALTAQLDAVRARIDLLVRLEGGFKAHQPVRKTENPVQAQADAAAMGHAVSLLARQAAKAAEALRREQTALAGQLGELNRQATPVGARAAA